jgi:hypothetical protein
MPGWKIHQNLVSPVLRAAGLDLSQVAYVNLLKRRTTASSGLARLHAISCDHHTREQLELLAPSRVIANGSDVGRASSATPQRVWTSISSRAQAGRAGAGGPRNPPRVEGFSSVSVGWLLRPGTLRR